MSLTNPREKMSKSDPKARSRIHITDAPEEIEKKIKGAVTDALGNITYDPVERPGIANLLDILSAFDKQGRTPAQLAEEFADQQAPDLKAAVTKALIDGLAEIRDRYQFFQENEKALKDAEETGTIRAIRSAGNTMSMVEKAVGIYDFFH
jgi:Tryptophanyl-tRNA synthetase